ncbi:MAG: DNA gyrase inhibitor YacG [Proteobacteria bacterium]|nr:DNA gyrase inhibitor YacG [Pseudomonadota bacterium]
MRPVKCPTCKREVEWNSRSAFRPFCSERCRMIDLGAWFNEENAIPGEPASPQEAETGPDPRPRDHR